MIKFNKSRLAATVGALALAGAAAPASAVVVVGGDNGWEISFDGNINVFYTVGDYDANTRIVNGGNEKTTSRVQTGLLPAFFSFNAKSPTYNGMTGTARISFAPQIQTGGTLTQIGATSTGGDGITGASSDVREVVFNLDGSFGQISLGRTLSLYGRQAILNDQTLFGVGASPANGNGGTTLGRIGYGYIYPDFASRIQYTTPMMNGFQAAVGLYDPSGINGISGQAGGTAGLLDEDSTPRVEAEVSFTTNVQNASLKLWADGSYQALNSSCTGTAVVGDDPAITYACDELDSYGIGGGAKVGFGGFDFVGYYSYNEGVSGASALFRFFGGPDVNNAATGTFNENELTTYYVQGAYTFGATKVAASYGQNEFRADGEAGVGDNVRNKNEMYTVGVYHDVTSWLKLIAEYNHIEGETITGGGVNTTPGEADTFSVGSFFFW